MVTIWDSGKDLGFRSSRGTNSCRGQKLESIYFIILKPFISHGNYLTAYTLKI